MFLILPKRCRGAEVGCLIFIQCVGMGLRIKITVKDHATEQIFSAPTPTMISRYPGSGPVWNLLKYTSTSADCKPHNNFALPPFCLLVFYYANDSSWWSLSPSMHRKVSFKKSPCFFGSFAEFFSSLNSMLNN